MPTYSNDGANGLMSGSLGGYSAHKRPPLQHRYALLIVRESAENRDWTESTPFPNNYNSV